MFSTFSRWVRVLQLSALVVLPPWTFLLLTDLSGKPFLSYLIFLHSLFTSICVPLYRFSPQNWSFAPLQDLGRCLHGSLPYCIWFRKTESWLCRRSIGQLKTHRLRGPLLFYNPCFLLLTCACNACKDKMELNDKNVKVVGPPSVKQLKLACK